VFKKNTQIITQKKPCVLGEASTQILPEKKGPRRPDLLLLLDVISVQLKNPITKMKERGLLNM
jgi:hypothetical protein